MIVPLTALLIVGLAATSVSAQKEICEKLSQCLAEVKTKESSCHGYGSAAPKANANATSADAAKDECAEAVNTKNEALKALTQRKTEAYGSCINTKAASAVAITNSKKKERCDALLARQSRVRRQRQADDDEEESKPKKGGRRGGSRRGRPRVSEQKDSGCQSELRQLRTRCAKLSKCCSVTKDCRKGDASLDQEIKEARAALRTQNRQCRSGAKAAGNKAKGGHRAGQKGRGNKAKTTTLAPTTTK